ncbi:MAG TPA: nucleoside-diphosphate kinase, partial [Pseudonocardiaceae bacterium]|nr:nucleoside-diphosphate kinase [Pseudonocardiaceae bacterium]
WTSSMLSVVTPDAIRRHLLGPVIERFRREGIRVANLCVAQITANQMYHLYEAIIDPLSEGHQALEHRMALGPSVALRLVPPDDGRDIQAWCRRLRELKGASSPAIAPPGSIRHDLGSVNQVLSILHASDSPQRARLESEILLGGDADPATWPDATAVAPLLDTIAAMFPRETRGFPEVVGQLRARIVFRLWGQLSDDGRALATRLVRSGDIAEPDAGRRIADHVAATGANRPLLTVLAAGFRPAVPRLDMAAVRRQLHAAGICLDDWSDAVLSTSVYFAPRCSRRYERMAS